MSIKNLEYVKVNKGLSKRLSHLMERSIEILYTRKDLELLKELLFASNYYFYTDKLNISDPVNDFLEYGCCEIDDITNLEWFDESFEKNVKVSLSQYLLIYHTKVFLFLTMPLVNVPKYIVSDRLRVYVEWRLLIGK